MHCLAPIKAHMKIYETMRSNVGAATPKGFQKEPKNDLGGTWKAGCIICNVFGDEIEINLLEF